MPEPAEPNMGLVLPTEGGDPGEYDTYLNDALTVVAAHNHTAGQGVKVPTAGLSIDADLSMSSGGNYFALKDVKAVDFQPQAAASMTAYAGAFFVNSTDANNLYFRSQAGTNVRITNGATLDTTTSGGIGGDYSSIPAELNFVDASKTYTHKSTAAGNWSRIQSGPVRIAEHATTVANYVELASPAALAASYTVTFPAALPAATYVVQMTSAGLLVVAPTTPITSGAIVSSGAITAGAGAHVTVSGAGEYKHGDKVLNITALSGFGNGTGPTNPAASNYAISGGAGTDWFMPLPLTVGDRVKSITWYYRRGAGTHTFAFRASTLSSGTDADVGTPASDAATSAYTSITQSTINKTLVATEGYYLRWAFTSANANNLLYSAQVTYDRP